MPVRISGRLMPRYLIATPLVGAGSRRRLDHDRSNALDKGTLDPSLCHGAEFVDYLQGREHASAVNLSLANDLIEREATRAA